MTLRAKSIAVSLLPLLFLLAALAWIFEASQRTAAAEDDVRTGLEVLGKIHAVHAQLAEAASGVRGYSITGREDFLQPYWRASAELGAGLAELQAKIRDPVMAAHVDEITELVQQKMLNLEEIRRQIADQRVAPPQEVLLDNKRLLDRLRQQITDMEVREREVIREREATAARVRARSNGWTAMAVTAGVASAVIAALMFSGSIVRRVRIIGANASRLEKGQPQLALPPDADELGQLAAHIASAGGLLAARAEEAQSARQEAERANRAKTEFLSRMSHELRTPLHAILGFSQLLEADLADDGARRHARTILAAGRHLLKLVNEVLDISRIEAGGLVLDLRPLALAPLVREAMALAEPEAQRRGVRLEVAAGLDEGQFVAGDAQRLLQVLINLLSNAVKFNRAGGRVCIDAQAEGGRLCVSVTDEGPGIDPQTQLRLFTPFERHGADGIDGTGLGLAVSKSLVEAMDGHIGVDSAVGAGARFWFSLRLASPPLANKPEPQTLTERDPQSNRTERQRRLLYIEDNRSNQFLVETLIGRRSGWVLKLASTAGEGMALLRAQAPDLLLLDLGLPDSDGLSVLQQIRADPALAWLPVVVLSADALPQTIERLLAAGADDYLLKPLDIARFDQLLERDWHDRG